MITMAIAIKEPTVTRRYRQMLTQSGFETHFVSTVQELIRTVKARPVDVILFDLGPSAVSPVEWLAAAAKDKDLEFTPVLWIGTKVPAPLQTVIQEYRPGVWLQNIPLTDELISTVLQLVGRKTEDKTKEEKTTSSDREWTPGTNIIEDALQIFDESGNHKPSSAMPRGASSNTAAMPVAASAPPGPTPAATAPRAPQPADDAFEIDSMELGRGAVPARMRATKAPTERTIRPESPSVARDKAVIAESPDDEITRITALVVEHLSHALVAKIDREMVRREVEAALRDGSR